MMTMVCEWPRGLFQKQQARFGGEKKVKKQA
jgi:hypothetical protein